MKVTKTILTERVHERAGGNFTDAEAMVDLALGEIARALAAGESLELRGLGSFRVSNTPARPGRNPLTGQTVTIPAQKRVHFKMGRFIRANINKGARDGEAAG